MDQNQRFFPENTKIWQSIEKCRLCPECKNNQLPICKNQNRELLRRIR